MQMNDSDTTLIPGNDTPLPAGKLQGSQLAVTVPAARGGAAALLREAEPVRDSLLQAAEEPMSDKVMLVVKQSARLR